jgi:hypothetical protein
LLVDPETDTNWTRQELKDLLGLISSCQAVGYIAGKFLSAIMMDFLSPSSATVALLLIQG